MAPAATVRFAELVKKGGKPAVHLSWVAPAKDAELQRAQKQQRLVTVHQHARGPRDFGVVGFEPAADAQFLVFPKSLRAFAGRKVIGIKYEMLKDSAADEPPAAPRKPRKPGAEKPRAKASKSPAPRKSSVPREGELAPEAEAEFVTDADPVKREVRKALIALTAGRTGEARRRLQAILSDGAGD